MLSIIIVNYKTSKDVIECLDSIIEYENKYKEYEIIIIDNNSHDDGLTIISGKYPFVRIIYAPKNGGFAYGNNIGITNSSGDYILLLNPDTYLQDNSIEKLFNRIRNDNTIDLIGSKLLYPDGTNQSYNCAKEYPTLWNLFCDQFNLNVLFKNFKVFNSYLRPYMNYDKETLLEHIPGAAFLFRRELIDKTGMMDENYFMYFEESDFCLQTIKHGGKILYYPGSQIVHKAGQSTSSGFSERSKKYFVESFFYYCRKNFGLAASYIAKLIFFTGSLTRYIVYFLKSDKRYTIYRYIIKYMLKSNT